MKLENFTLVRIEGQQIIEIEYLEAIYDFHNAAEFLRFEYDVKSSLLTLFWNYHFYEKEMIVVQIKFEETNYFQVLPRDIEAPKEEDDCLEEIIHNEKLEFKFMGGMTIIVEAEKVIFQIEPTKKE